MARLSYDSVEALIFDPVPAGRTATRAALYALGFRHTESVHSLETFLGSVAQRPPDLVLAEAHGTGEDLCGAIRQIRQGQCGENPFIVIIVTAWEKGTGLVGRVIGSGADDLLLRPFSTGLLGQRLENHIERRKGFVVTSDYIGPDRRHDPGRTGGDRFEPPNSLKMKARERLSAEAVARRMGAELKVARERLSGEKLRRDVFQVCVQWRLLLEPRAGDPPLDMAGLAALAQSIAARCRDTAHAAAVEWCEAVVSAIEGQALGVGRSATMHLLGDAALKLHAVFHPGLSQAERLQQIDATVALMRARNDRAALAS